MGDDFISYAFKDLPRKKIKKYATQYDGVDMSLLMGADEEHLPFLIRNDSISDDDEPFAFQVMLWNVHFGIMTYLDEDSVRDYATMRYLREHAYPIFASLDEAEKYAAERNWPRKPLE